MSLILEDPQLHDWLGSGSRIYRLAFEREDAKDTLVCSAQRLLSNETFQGFDTEGELPAGE